MLENQLVQYYQRINELLREGYYDDAAVNVRRFLETLINAKIARFFPEYINNHDITLAQKLSVLCQNNIISQSNRHLVYFLKDVGNRGSHPDPYHPLNYQAIQDSLNCIERIIRMNYQLGPFDKNYTAGVSPPVGNTFQHTSTPDGMFKKMLKKISCSLISEDKSFFYLGRNLFELLLQIVCLIHVRIYAWPFITKTLEAVRYGTYIDGIYSKAYFRSYFDLLLVFAILLLGSKIRTNKKISEWFHSAYIFGGGILCIFFLTLLASFGVTIILTLFAGVLRFLFPTQISSSVYEIIDNCSIIWYIAELGIFIIVTAVLLFYSLNSLRKMFKYTILKKGTSYEKNI